MEAWGGISLRIRAPPVRDFDDYFRSLKPKTNTRNPWFAEFWESRFNCSFANFSNADENDVMHSAATEILQNTSVRVCTGKYEISNKFQFLYCLLFYLHQI